MGLYDKVSGGFDRTADIPGKSKTRYITSADATAGVVELETGDTSVIAEIPLAAADSYVIKLPPISDTVGQRYSLYGRRATGSYVDGEVTVDDHGDGGLSATDGMTATGDHLCLEPFMGLLWKTVYDVTT